MEEAGKRTNRAILILGGGDISPFHATTRREKADAEGYMKGQKVRTRKKVLKRGGTASKIGHW